MKNLKSKYIFIIIAFVIILVSPVYALPKPNNDFYVYDDANILDETTEEYIITTNTELYQQTGAQIVVTSINDLEGMDINRYATALFDEWDIGGAQLDNGLLILIVPNEGEIWIEVGYGLEGVLPDSRVKRIIENNIIPYFSQGDYNTGVLSGYEEILDYVESEYNIQLETRNDEYYAPNNQNHIGNKISSIYIIIGIIIFMFIDFRFFRGWLTYSIFRGFGRGGGNYKGSGRNGGGSSRGGGGRSGGGGAGGRW
ncbi:TPM domain-containing protein [Paratissierella segnis]|jgi:uncharacterized protein|uniref:TPM domain-containing protein n=1 Tax=Paratissierella segnis TaxID=2763679 RepID=A0A926ETF9_9FIRM|nr:TPM domain-containing protein [Paratissierella segnis]MBC8588185.1 TPM domain-containing protein [Paratissierella segnis]